MEVSSLPASLTLSTNPWYLIPLINWYKNSLMVGYPSALCKSEQDFLKLVKSLKMKAPPIWLPEGSAACCHSFARDGDILSVVCIRKQVKRTKHEINALLVHESVHVWQTYRDSIGEKHPGREQEAYSIQRISENLMAEYWKPIPKPLKRKKKR